VHPVDFDIGDFVLVAKCGRRKKDKTSTPWDGPALITQAVSPLVFEVKDLLTGKLTTHHARFIRRYADKSLRVTQQLKQFVAASVLKFDVKDILTYRRNKGDWEFLVSWDGFDDEDSTWQNAQELYRDIPELVSRFVNHIQDDEVKTTLQKLLGFEDK
jgi:hypothetical protein